MDQPVIQYGLEKASPFETAGTLAALFVEDLAFAAEYWLTRGLQMGLGAMRWTLRRPALIAASVIVLSATSAAAWCVFSGLYDSQVRTASLDLNAIENGIELYRLEKHHFPARLEDLRPHHLRELHVDPWGRNYVLYRGAGGMAIASAGPDGELGTRDDIVVVLPQAPSIESDEATIHKCRQGYCEPEAQSKEP